MDNPHPGRCLILDGVHTQCPHCAAPVERVSRTNEPAGGFWTDGRTAYTMELVVVDVYAFACGWRAKSCTKQSHRAT